MAVVTKPLVLDETVKEFNRDLIEILDNITAATDMATQAGQYAASASNKATLATNSANSAAASATEASNILSSLQLINNSGNADTISAANAADIITLKKEINNQLDSVNILHQYNFSSTYFNLSADGVLSQKNTSSAPFAWTYSTCAYKFTVAETGTYVIEYSPVTPTTNTSSAVNLIGEDNTIIRNLSILNVTSKKTTEINLTAGDNVGLSFKLYEGTCKLAVYPKGEGKLASVSYVDRITSNVGRYGVSTFSVNANTVHSSASDQVRIDIKAGEQFAVRGTHSLSNSDLWGQVFSYKDGVATLVAGATLGYTYVYTATVDIDNIGLYTPSKTSSYNVNFEVLVLSAPGLKSMLDTVQSSTQGGNFISSATTDIDLDTPVARYSALLSGRNNTEQFLFFTDPHVFQHTVNENAMKKAIGSIEYVYNSSPTSFVLCGGDWLQDSDTASEACYKLGRIDGMMRAKFGDNYYPILGNHDTNYQGASYQTSQTFEDKLSNNALRNLWFRNYGSMYYSFKGQQGTRFYVFDSQLDWSQNMGDYFWEQCKWFAQQLITNDDRHSVIAIHIILNTSEATSVVPFVDNLTSIAAAYNSRSSISVNGTTYNFASTTGKVAFVIGGHLHSDRTSISNGIPYVITTNSSYNPSFDLCLIDYDNATLKTVRVGSGADRSINIIV